MARFVVLGGTGMMGRVVVHDLYKTTKNDIVLVGSNIKKAKKEAEKYKKNRVVPAAVDVNNISATVKVLKNADVVLNCVQYYYNLNVMKAALNAGCHYVDLGGLFHMTKKQLKLNKQFKNAGLTAVIGMGSTPGITNILAAYGSEFFYSVKEIRIEVGSRDFSIYKEPPLIPYSLQTLIDEFTMKPAIFKKGRLKFVQPVSGRTETVFSRPVGKRSIILTLHSELATFPKSFSDKGVKEISFRVDFDEEFVEKILFLVKLVPKDILAKIASSIPKPKIIKQNNYECLKIVMRGYNAGKQKTINICCVAKSFYELPAGDIDTASPLSIAAQMIVNGDIKERGVFPPEFHVPPKIFFKQLRKRGMRIYVTK